MPPGHTGAGGPGQRRRRGGSWARASGTPGPASARRCCPCLREPGRGRLAPATRPGPAHVYAACRAGRPGRRVPARAGPALIQETTPLPPPPGLARLPASRPPPGCPVPPPSAVPPSVFLLFSPFPLATTVSLLSLPPLGLSAAGRGPRSVCSFQPLGCSLPPPASQHPHSHLLLHLRVVPLLPGATEGTSLGCLLFSLLATMSRLAQAQTSSSKPLASKPFQVGPVVAVVTQWPGSGVWPSFPLRVSPCLLSTVR